MPLLSFAEISTDAGGSSPHRLPSPRVPGQNARPPTRASLHVDIGIRRLESVRRDFVSNVSHELRTPLASLKALTETLQEGALEDPPAARRFLLRMDDEIDNLTQLVHELLELSRIESGKVPLEQRATRPDELLGLVAERMQIQAARVGLALRVECPADLPLVSADMTRMEQVLVNLVHNAIKFTPKGEIFLSAYRENRSVVFFVRDTGVGISSEDLPRIFERFFKADRSRSGGGTGLGLSIARHVVEAHGGRMWVDSQPGQGSVFSFCLPFFSQRFIEFWRMTIGIYQAKIWLENSQEDNFCVQTPGKLFYVGQNRFCSWRAI